MSELYSIEAFLPFVLPDDVFFYFKDSEIILITGFSP